MVKRFSYFTIGCGIFFVFIIFSYLVHKNLFNHFDFNMTVRLQDHIPRRFDGFFSLLSIIGNIEVVSVFLLGLIIINVFLKRKWQSFFFFGSFLFFHVFELYGKLFVQHRPPPHFMLRTIQSNFPQFYVSAENSYPSGHAARAAFVSIVIFIFTAHNKKLSHTQKLAIYAFVGIYDLLMITSRVYLGEHWTSDVIGGVFLGSSIALLSALIY